MQNLICTISISIQRVTSCKYYSRQSLLRSIIKMKQYFKLVASSVETPSRWSADDGDASDAGLLDDSDSVKQRPFYQKQKSIILHLLLLAVNIVILIISANIWHTAGHTYDTHDGTPLRPTISYEKRKFDTQKIYLEDGTLNPSPNNYLNGPPRKQLEDAWDNLMQHESFRVQKSELGQFADNNEIVQLTDGSGYYSTVSVFHGLHCVQRLHHILYPEQYSPGLSEEKLFTLKRHTEHCLDWLREYVRCNADTTLIPILWKDSIATPVAADTGLHQCVAWDPLYDWMASRSFHPETPGLLIHPIFGDPYANRSGPDLGVVPLGHDHGH